MMPKVDLRATGPIPRAVAFRVAPGEVLALLGPSGAGRTIACTLPARRGRARGRAG